VTAAGGPPTGPTPAVSTALVVRQAARGVARSGTPPRLVARCEAGRVGYPTPRRGE